MRLFGKSQNEEDREEDLIREEISRKRIKDLKSGNKRKRKEPEKPWDKKERLFILITLVSTLLIAIFLSISANGFRLSNLKFIQGLNFDIFKSQPIIIEAPKAK